MIKVEERFAAFDPPDFWSFIQQKKQENDEKHTHACNFYLFQIDLSNEQKLYQKITILFIQVSPQF